MTEQELRDLALDKIGKALSMELDADLTAAYITALAAILSASPSTDSRAPTVKV